MAAPVPEHPEQKANYGSSSTRELSDETIGAIFRELDLDGSGYLSEQEMAEVFHQLQLPFARGDFAVALEEHDTDGDGQLSLGEFSTLIRAGSTKRRELFDAIDVDHDGVWSRDEIRAGFGHYFHSDKDLEAFVDQLMRADANHDGAVSFAEFTRWAAFKRANSLPAILDLYRGELDLGEDSTPPSAATTDPARSPHTMEQRAGILGAGFAAGALSRTATAPLERMKTLFQTGQVARTTGFGAAVAATVREQGLRSLWRGNLANCLKVAPAKAVKFALFESVRGWICQNPRRPTTLENFGSAASVSGFVTAAVHPIDTIKTRLAVSSSQGSIQSTVAAIRAESGWGGFGRGLLPALASSVPFSGTNMATFMAGKQAYQDYMSRQPGGQRPQGAPPVVVCVGLSVVSTVAAQFVSYPLYSVKACLQSGYPHKGATATDCVRAIVAERGLTGLYRGVGINAAKATPAVAVTYTVYEKTKEFLCIP